MNEVSTAARHEVDDENGRRSGFSYEDVAEVSSVHAQFHNHFFQERHLVSRALQAKTLGRV